MQISTSERLKELADNPVFVLVFYALILAPLALYVYHDVLDKKWRPVWSLTHYVILYIALYFIAGTATIIYIIIQVYARDFKEVGASALALVVGTYGAWKLFRLARIIIAHRELIKVLQKIDRYLASTTGLKPVGLPIHIFRPPTTQERRFRKYKFKSKDVPTNKDGKVDWLQEYRHAYISSALFDDDYPGDAAARIRWFSLLGKGIRVVPDDADECVSRLAIWMRLVLRRPRSEPWRLLTSSSPLVSGILFNGSLGKALRNLVTYGSSRIPQHVHDNPAEILLNGGRLTDVGIGFFWTSAQMGTDEVSQVLAEMPPPWMRGVTQNGKQLIFEMAMSLVLREMPHPGNIGLDWILSIPVLEWSRDIQKLQMWETMAEICADAVSAATPLSPFISTATSPQLVYDTVRQSIFDLGGAESEEYNFQGDTIGLSILELIRASYRAGYLAEKLLGKELKHHLIKQQYLESGLRLYKAEIVLGLYTILTQLGLDDTDEYRHTANLMKKEWGVSEDVDDLVHALQISLRQKAPAKSDIDLYGDNENDVTLQSRLWFLCEQNKICVDPILAFTTITQTAVDLAPAVLQMLQTYFSVQPRVTISKALGDPEEYREKWLNWKQKQALELRGELGDFSIELIRVDSNGREHIVNIE